MKRLFILSAVVLSTFLACKKEPAIVSKQVTVSSPTITFPLGQFLSIPVGGTKPVVSVTAYDSVLMESIPVTDTGTVDTTTPNLYLLTAVARNSNGYVNTSAIYCAVTDVSSSIDLSGMYVRVSNSDTVNVTKMANGLYMIDNVGGVDPLQNAALSMTVAYFAHLDDTTIVVPAQPTDAGTLYCDGAKLTMAPGDTSFQYIVHNASFGTAVRVFQKL